MPPGKSVIGDKGRRDLPGPVGEDLPQTGKEPHALGHAGAVSVGEVLAEGKQQTPVKEFLPQFVRGKCSAAFGNDLLGDFLDLSRAEGSVYDSPGK